jgi:ribonuclease HII
MRLPAPAQFVCTRRFEAIAARRGCRLVAGCDEVGRGAMAGPLYAAAVILDPARRIRGLDDSKKLTADIRTALDGEIRSKAIALRVFGVPTADVDRLNVYQASRIAMIRALGALIPSPDFVLTDAMRLTGWGDTIEFPVPYRAIVHGDARSASIAAASILAKVSRDKYMIELDRLYPQYGLAANKGYCTPEHLETLFKHGPCPEHRRTFAPVKASDLPLFPSPSLVDTLSATGQFFPTSDSTDAGLDQ